jgi:hypothetical protein
MDISSNSSKGEGNTISSPSSVKQISPSKRWCFTLNNYTNDEISSIVPIFKSFCKIAFFSKEVGESGTKHLQGYCEFISKKRPISVFASATNRIKWIKAKGDMKSNLEYCTKDTPLFFSLGIPKPVKTITPNMFYNYQQDIYDIIKQDPDDRTINWYWESKGKTGKTSFTKYLCVHHGAIVLSGKTSDCFNAVLTYIQNNNGNAPEIIIFDIPRSTSDYTNFQVIEKVKDGCFYSGKYEGGQVLYNPPHIIVFSNYPPDTDNLSQDRWNIIKIKI